jgi:hypothetical protein
MKYERAWEGTNMLVYVFLSKAQHTLVRGRCSEFESETWLIAEPKSDENRCAISATHIALVMANSAS